MFSCKDQAHVRKVNFGIINKTVFQLKLLDFKILVFSMSMNFPQQLAFFANALQYRMHSF